MKTYFYYHSTIFNVQSESEYFKINIIHLQIDTVYTVMKLIQYNADISIHSRNHLYLKEMRTY